MDEAGRPALFDAHTHFGQNDPDTFRQTPEELLAGLDRIGARGARLPDARARRLRRGQRRRAGGGGGVRRPADRAVPRAAARRRRRARRGAALHGRRRGRDQAAPARRGLRHGGARRARPHGARPRAPGGRAHARRARDPGARRQHDPLLRAVPGRADDPRALRDLRPRLARARAAVAPQRLHRHVVVASGRHPRALLPRAARAGPVGQRLALRPAAAQRAAASLRCALEAGLTPRAARGRLRRAGASGCCAARTRSTSARRPGPPRRWTPCSSAWWRNLTAALGRAIGGADPTEPLGLARLAAGVGDGHPQAGVFAAILWLLDLFEEHDAPPPPGRALLRRRPASSSSRSCWLARRAPRCRPRSPAAPPTRATSTPRAATPQAERRPPRLSSSAAALTPAPSAPSRRPPRATTRRSPRDGAGSRASRAATSRPSAA